MKLPPSSSRSNGASVHPDGSFSRRDPQPVSTLSVDGFATHEAGLIGALRLHALRVLLSAFLLIPCARLFLGLSWNVLYAYLLGTLSTTASILLATSWATYYLTRKGRPREFVTRSGKYSKVNND